MTVHYSPIEEGGGDKDEFPNPIKRGSLEYTYVHSWVRRHYGLASKCEKCGIKDLARYEWALKKGLRYERNVKNFIQLCPHCHKKYDNHCSMIGKYSLGGAFIQEYLSIKDAATENEILTTSIINALNGSSKSAGGFRWKYSRKAVRKIIPQSNVTNAKILTINGVSKNMAEWSLHLGGRPSLVHVRLKQGWSAERAISTPTRKK